MVEQRTEKPGTVLVSDYGSILRYGKVFFLTLSAFSADSRTVFAQPPCAVTCINICAHTLAGIGSAALAAAVALLG